MQPNYIYRVERGAAPVLLLYVVGRIRSNPHQLLVLVTLCTKCEEDVGIYDEETQELRFSKSEISVDITESDNLVVKWREKCLPPRAPVISTSPFPLATLPLRSSARRVLVTDEVMYQQAYTQYGRTLTQYTENNCFQKPVLQPWMFQSALSWLQTPPALQPPARRAERSGGRLPPEWDERITLHGSFR